MKNRITLKLASAALLLGAPLAQAFTYVAGDVNLGGIGYAGYVTVGATGSGSVSDHTGAWSWEDQGIAPGGAGVVIQWPAADSGWVLESSPDLQSAWQTVTLPRIKAAGSVQLNDTPGPASARFYRLRRTW
jgi:hypothetical protein